VIPVKPWLLEILACPIDKHYPLSLSIFKIEDGDEFSKKVGNIEAMKKDLSFFFKNTMENEDSETNAEVPVINLDDTSGALLVFDTLVRKPSTAVQYLEQIVASIDELKPIQDSSGNDVKSTIETLLEFRSEVTSALDAVKEAIEEPETQKQKILELEDKLILLNWFKQAVEIEAGVITCTECNRWYPIRDTIPQMLPDELRKEKYDKNFLETWSSLLDDSILKDGNPFHLD